jgi:hypothetical protein
MDDVEMRASEIRETTEVWNSSEPARQMSVNRSGSFYPNRVLLLSRCSNFRDNKNRVKNDTTKIWSLAGENSQKF